MHNIDMNLSMNLKLELNQHVQFKTENLMEYFGIVTEVQEEIKIQYLGTNNVADDVCSIKPLTEEMSLVATFYLYCITNYDEGYDVFIECYSNEELLEYIQEAGGIDSALSKAKEYVQIREEQRSNCF